MMKSEFEKLLGFEVTPEQYRKIENVYMHIEKMTKEKIASLYKTDELFVTNCLYDHILTVKSRECDYEREKKLNDNLDMKLGLLQDTIARLQSENEVLENDNENLISDLQDYETENAKLIAENEVLQNKIAKLEKENAYFRLIKSVDTLNVLENENDELRTQLHQYQSLFADIEEKMTVNLYESLLGSVAN